MSKPTRQELERWVVDHLISATARHGYQPTRVWDGGDWVKTPDRASMADAVFSVDACQAYFRHPAQPKGHCVVIIFGNDGWDAIADCSMGEKWDDVMKECDEYADMLEESYGE